MIERARQRRKFEAQLPPLEQKNFELRKKMLETQEELEWSWRDKEIKK
jgi:hypothetical protein